MDGTAVGMGAGKGWQAATTKIAHNQILFLMGFIQTL
jgi:hypothetical protein